jgi:uncharacterized protein YgiM (DUF1202 family)
MKKQAAAPGSRHNRMIPAQHTYPGLFWVGIIALIVCAACTMTSDATSTPRSASTSMTVAPATPTLPVTITPVMVLQQPRDPLCPDTPLSRLILYERGQVTQTNEESLNLRAGPGTSFRILRRLPPGSVFFVIGGPECGSNYTWFRVQFEALEGWLAEGDFNEYYTQPYLSG